MKARKISLKNYNVTVKSPNNETKEIPYDIKESLIEILFNPELKLTARQLLKANDLASKIEKANDNILLNDVEYEKLKHALETVKGLTKNEIVLVKRVLQAEEVDVEEVGN